MAPRYERGEFRKLVRRKVHIMTVMTVKIAVFWGVALTGFVRNISIFL